ncbi:MAG: mechanosensitive ion channel [Flavobacteriaceae bacterium]|jgi:small-conductance mechanosensitive channel|nr:mechanosensitive ion channel family protein [Flavobacteriaceae bacterium]MDG1063210.1 mechanosensitive ion channel [Flavobacteriaceae bacterium]MDG1961549.1 mechanosensitive ion channel [Flavobacteriaceae bacterium]
MLEKPYILEIILTLIILLVGLITKTILTRIAHRYSHKNNKVLQRTLIIDKLIKYSVMSLVLLALFLIWGVNFKDVGVVVSSVFAVIGIAFFAQWSILSNITSGVIMFFTFPYKIGDFIMIHDKEYDYQGIIEEIRTFHIVLKTKDNQTITYPNSLLLQKGVSIMPVQQEKNNDDLL